MVLNSIETVKPVFLLSLMCMFPESNKASFWSQSFHLQNLGILQTRIDERRTPWKWTLTIFKYKNEYHKQSSKSKWKKWRHLSNFFFSSWVMVLKLPKIVHFLLICADLSKKPKSIKRIYFYPSERPPHALSENSIFYRGPSNNSQDIKE